MKETIHTFDDLGIAPRLLEALKAANFVTPTPIQRQAIPVAIKGNDIIGIAQTGTGKTLAFGIPTLQRLAEHKGRGLILLPTRELALQVEESISALGKQFGLRTAVLIGGAPFDRQKRELSRKPHIIIATPGRLIDHVEQKFVNLSDVKMLVLDEADRMLDMGFAPQIKQILRTVPADRQTMLFSATMPQAIVGIATAHMKLPVRIEVVPPGTTAERVTHEVFMTKRDDKMPLLVQVLDEYKGTVIVFSRTKHGAKKITSDLNLLKISSAEIHSNRTLMQRRAALDGFKSGRYRVLVATDIAARGIDVENIELVVNFDLPENPDDYVHRIGRTARAGREGHAISFALPNQGSDVRQIEKLIRAQIPISKLPSLSKLNLPKAAPMTPEERGGGGPRRPRRARMGDISRSGGRPVRGNSFARHRTSENKRPEKKKFSRGASAAGGRRSRFTRVK